MEQTTRGAGWTCDCGAWIPVGAEHDCVIRHLQSGTSETQFVFVPPALDRIAAALERLAGVMERWIGLEERKHGPA